MRTESTSLLKKRGIFTITVILAVSAILVYTSFYPDMPRIMHINETPRQTGGTYQEPVVSNPQVAIIPPPEPDAGNVIPPEEKVGSGVLNVIAAAPLVMLGSFGAYLLFRYRREAARRVFSILITFLAVVTSRFFADEAVNLFEFVAQMRLDHWLKLVVTMVATISLGVFTAKTLLISGGARGGRRLVCMFTGILAGSFIAAVVPIYVNIFFSIFIALYDVYAVKWGAVKSLVKIEDALVTIVAFEDGDWSLGLGDVIVYAMLPSSCLAYAMTYSPRFAFYGSSPPLDLLVPWIVFTAVASSMVFGLAATLKLLERRDIMPGLTIPVLSGCCTFGLCLLVMQCVNYAGWGWLVPLL